MDLKGIVCPEILWWGGDAGADEYFGEYNDKFHISSFDLIPYTLIKIIAYEFYFYLMAATLISTLFYGFIHSNLEKKMSWV